MPLCFETNFTWRRNPRDEGEDGKSRGDTKNQKDFNSSRLLANPRQVLVPDGEELLLTVRMCDKLLRWGGWECLTCVKESVNSELKQHSV